MQENTWQSNKLRTKPEALHFVEFRSSLKLLELVPPRFSHSLSGSKEKQPCVNAAKLYPTSNGLQHTMVPPTPRLSLVRRLTTYIQRFAKTGKKYWFSLYHFSDFLHGLRQLNDILACHVCDLCFCVCIQISCNYMCLILFWHSFLFLATSSLRLFQL